MNKYAIINWKKVLCYVCAILLCLQLVASVSAEEGRIWTNDALHGVSFREAANYGWYVCAYNPAKNQEKKLSLAPSFRVSPASGNGEAVMYYVRGIDDGVFGMQEDGSSHVFSLIYIQAAEGMTIGRSAFQGVVVQGDSSADYAAKITGNNLAKIGEYAFEEAKIRGDFSIAGIKGTIGQGAFYNTKIDGNFTIQNMEECVIERGAFEQLEAGGKLTLGGSIDTLGNYALSGFSAKNISMPDNIIRHMGDRVFYNTKLNGKTYPLSDYLETIGSNVFEGTGIAALRLPNSNTMKEVAKDAFPDTEGMTIIIPEKLTNLEVYHFNRYHHLTFQTAEGLSDDSPVIRYLTENGLPYKKGADGEVIVPKPTATPEPTETPGQKPEETAGAEPTETPGQKPEETAGAKPTVTPESTETPGQKPEETAGTEPTVTPGATETPSQKATATPGSTETPGQKPTATPGPTEMPGQTAQPMPTATSSAGTSVTVNVSQTVGPTVVQGVVPEQPSQNTEDTTNKPSSMDDTTVYKVGKLKYEMAGKNKAVVVGVASGSITAIVIPDHVEIHGRLYRVIKVRKRAFYGQKSLKKVRTGNYVREVGEEAFAMCPRLVQIQFGTGLVKIGKRALYQDKGLRKIVFHGTKLKKIGKETFSGVSPKKVSIKVKKSKMAFYRQLIEKAK